MNPRVPFLRPYISPKALDNVEVAIAMGYLVGQGKFSRACEKKLQEITRVKRAYLTPSGTAALEMAALTMGLATGHEVIMPSFTFPSTANAVVLRGATPVFCDVRPDTLNVDAALISNCITPKTRAVIVVHYAGNPASMRQIVELCRDADIGLIEDGAQSLGASFEGAPTGSFGDFGALSFHDTKNIGAGEGGALLLNSARMASKVEVHREKGTNRTSFLRGEVSKYNWQDVGSSWIVSELVAAYLDAQLQDLNVVTASRVNAWNGYHKRLADAEAKGLFRRPGLTPGSAHNGHIYYVLLRDAATCQRVSAQLLSQGVEVARHYVPLHTSPAGRKYGRALDLPVTDDLPERQLRLPLWHDMSDLVQDEVVDALISAV